MPPGFLCVFAEPGAQVTLSEFQDWYNNEHVPLRLNHLPSFLSGARYSLSSSPSPSSSSHQPPTWLALYDISSTSVFQHPSYTHLRANRSPRESALVQRLSVLDRRTCALAYDSGESLLTSSLKYDNPTPVLVTLGLNFLSEEEGTMEEWARNVTETLSRDVKGWVRTRAFLCIDSLKTGLSIPDGPEAQKVPKYLVVLEFTSSSESLFTQQGVKDILTTPGIEEVRTWSLYRAYPCIAQGNLPSTP